MLTLQSALSGRDFGQLASTCVTLRSSLGRKVSTKPNTGCDAPGRSATIIMKTASSFHVPDGLSEIKNELPLIMEMIARTARWVHPKTFKALPIWCPDTARGFLRYDARWSPVLVNRQGVQKKKKTIR